MGERNNTEINNKQGSRVGAREVVQEAFVLPPTHSSSSPHLHFVPEGI